MLGDGGLARCTWRPVQVCGSYVGDFNTPALWAGLTTFVWYAVGLVPVQVTVTGQFGLARQQVTSWIFIIWFSGSLLGILPRAYLVALAGLAILPSRQQALERAFGGELRFGALLASLAASFVTQGGALRAYWRGSVPTS